jgi:hypothetical protein
MTNSFGEYRKKDSTPHPDRGTFGKYLASCQAQKGTFMPSCFRIRIQKKTLCLFAEHHVLKGTTSESWAISKKEGKKL